MLTDHDLGGLVHIVATAREKNKECPAAKYIDAAMTKAKLFPRLDTSMELIAIVAANAISLPQGSAPALGWIAESAAKIARELRGE